MKNLCFLFICLPLWSSSQTLELVKTSESYPITPVAGLYRDVTGQLSFEQIQKQKFVPIRKRGLLFPFGDAASWLKITLTNRHPERKQWVLEWDNPMAEVVDFYVSDNTGNYQVKKTGVVITGNRILMAENKPYFEFDLDYEATKTVFIRVKGQRAHFASVALFSEKAYYRHDLIQSNLYGFLSGAMAIRLFYVFLLAIFAVKDKDFRQYSVLLVARSIAFWGLHGILGNFFLNPNSALIVSFLSFHILPLGLIVAFRVIFPGKRFPLWVDRILQLIIVINILLAVSVLFGYRWQLLLASTYLVIVTQLFILAMYVFAIIKKYPINWNYSVAYLLGLGSYIFIQMRLVGWVGFAWISPVALLFFMLEFLVFGYFLGRIVIDYERNRALSLQELSFTKEQAVRVQELDRLKTRFFTNISHEFRTPLTLLSGPLEEIRQKYPKEGMIPMMQRNVKRLQVLINQLLDLSKLEAGEFRVEAQHGDIATFFSYIFSSFESLAQNQNIHFNVSQSHRSFETYFDADKIEKITTNLLSNAFKFTPANGRVMIKVMYETIGFECRAVLEVQDNGIGIDAQQLPLIFDRFYQIDDTALRNYEGTGIGLALVKELVDLLKGTVTVKSDVNSGTTFRVELPLPKPTQEITTDFSPNSPLDYQPESVIKVSTEGPAVVSLHLSETLPILLIVEDNPDLLLYLRGIFEPYYQIVEALNGQIGLELAFEIVPDIVVTDLMMPKLDGFELCQQLKSDQRTSHIPVVLLTAKATLADRLEGYELGADDYLQKPFNKEELLVRVKNLVQQRALLRQKFSLLSPDPLEQSTTASQDQEKQFIQKAHAIVEAHLSDSRFDIEDFCKEIGMSRTNLHRKLKALTGVSTTEFIRKIRLEKAAQLLRQRNVTVSEIAYRVGFESLPYFSKSFQEQFGMSPSEYARNA
ncbi:ATP-binding protein [Runella sp.]|uniref:ATP-binding protein n=1 Tax=Runella sp. TaxID=1960881 RepID=UPI003D13CDAC